MRGLRKYLSAAAQLFDQRRSYAKLLYIHQQDMGGENSNGMIEVKWELGGIINLPWHPEVEPWTGWTKYHLDEDGLVYLHEEGWDICTLFPQAREWRGWKRPETKDDDVVS